MNNLRIAAQRMLDAIEDSGHKFDVMTAAEALRAALEQEQAEPDLSRCPQCNGPADNGHDRSVPPSPYICTSCMAEPVQEPVARVMISSNVPGRIDEMDVLKALPRGEHLLYTAPPRRTMVPLTEEEIWALYFSLPSDDLDRSERVDFARAIEKASWEKNHG